MLAIPYITPSGVVSIRFRNLSGHGAKYLTVAGDIPRIYNTSDLELMTRAVCVTEGEFDCAIAWQCGLPSIGLPGVDQWRPEMGLLLEQYDAVYVLSDDDTAGKRFPEILGRDLKNIRDVPMAGGDVTDFFMKHGKDELKKKVGAR